jgi:hypothetical protein
VADSVHITRAKDWNRSDEAPISLDEWRAAIVADGDLQRDKDDDSCAVWTAHPEWSELPTFRWTKGRIVLDRPDEETIAKATDIARRLRARVVGDNGNTYHDSARESTGALAARGFVADRPKLLRSALNEGVFHGGWIRDGLLPRRIRLTVHSADETNYFLIIVHRPDLRNLAEADAIDIIPLAAVVTRAPETLLGMTVGFRLVMGDGKQIAVWVGEPELWLRWLADPTHPVTLRGS